MEKVRWLKIEQRIIDIDIALKTAVVTDSSALDLDKAMKSMNEFDAMAVVPLMLKKQPDIVTTIRKLRRYVGPVNSEKEFAPKAEKIRLKAESIYNKLRGIFQISPNDGFQDAFENLLSEFKSATKTMPEDQIIALVSDPTKRTSKRKVK